MAMLILKGANDKNKKASTENKLVMKQTAEPVNPKLSTAKIATNVSELKNKKNTKSYTRYQEVSSGGKSIFYKADNLPEGDDSMVNKSFDIRSAKNAIPIEKEEYYANLKTGGVLPRYDRDSGKFYPAK